MGKYYRTYRILYSVISLLLLILLAAYHISINSILLFVLPLSLFIVSCVAMLFGLLIMFAAIKKYFFRLSGVHAITQEKIYRKPETGGLNKYIRHPLYAGTFIFIWSAFFIIPLLTNLIGCFVITIYTLIAIRFEEKKLINEFGEKYFEYKKTVPMLIPKLKSAGK